MRLLFLAPILLIGCGSGNLVVNCPAGSNCEAAVLDVVNQTGEFLKYDLDSWLTHKGTLIDFESPRHPSWCSGDVACADIGSHIEIITAPVVAGYKMDCPTSQSGLPHELIHMWLYATKHNADHDHERAGIWTHEGSMEVNLYNKLDCE